MNSVLDILIGCLIWILGSRLIITGIFDFIQWRRNKKAEKAHQEWILDSLRGKTERIVLNEKEWASFQKALNEPAKPNEALKRLMKGKK